MIFKEGHLYHIYNQGNNRGKIFFIRENYLFFLRKMNLFILPYADLLAWCLMPNHFHLMVYVRPQPIIDGVTLSHPVNDRTTQSYPVNDRTFNNSIGIMLRSYTRAINKQEDRSGSLFREETKAICLSEINGITPSWFNSAGITYFTSYLPEKAYPQVCFNYIHQNPVNAGLVKTPGEWEFSSFVDCIGLRKGKLVNHERIKEFGLETHLRSESKSPHHPSRSEFEFFYVHPFGGQKRRPDSRQSSEQHYAKQLPVLLFMH